MPNPPFQPLTLSPEQWKAHCECTETPHCQSGHPLAFRAEAEAQAQKAASLRQRLEDCEKLRKGAEQDEEMTHEECEALKGKMVWANDHIQVLAAQLEQAQQERDGLAHLQLETADKLEQAEAALAEMQKYLQTQRETFAAIVKDPSRKEDQKKRATASMVTADDALAELQRRRSAPGQEKG